MDRDWYRTKLKMILSFEGVENWWNAQVFVKVNSRLQTEYDTDAHLESIDELVISSKWNHMSVKVWTGNESYSSMRRDGLKLRSTVMWVQVQFLSRVRNVADYHLVFWRNLTSKNKFFRVVWLKLWYSKRTKIC